MTQTATACALLLAFLSAGTSCRHAFIAAPIDPDLSACVPADATLLAGGNLDQIRASDFYRQLGVPLLDAFRDSSYLLIASNGNAVLIIARGNFPQAPAGTTLVSSTLALAGSPELVHAAIAQHRSGHSGAPDLLSRASVIAAGSQFWAVAPGGVSLPVSGNLANLNRLFHSAESVTLRTTIDQLARFELRAQCRNADAAREFEESLRAFLSLAGRFQSVDVRRENLGVRAEFSADAGLVRKMLPH